MGMDVRRDRRRLRCLGDVEHTGRGGDGQGGRTELCVPSTAGLETEKWRGSRRVCPRSVERRQRWVTGQKGSKRGGGEPPKGPLD